MSYPMTTIFLVLLSLASFSTSQTVPKKQCATGVHIISGHAHQGGPLGPQLGGLLGNPKIPPIKRAADDAPPKGYGMLFPLYGGIKSAIPGSDNYTVDYPSYSSAQFPKEIHGSTVNITNAILEYAKSCPNTPIVLTGYSEGAISVSNALCGSTAFAEVPTTPIPRSFKKRIIATILYGDESHPADQPYMRGGCKTAGPLLRFQPDSCDPFKSIIRSYCVPDDIYCCLGGTSRNDHFVYADMFTDKAINFVASQWRKYKLKHG